jgi:hypothetical protein
MLSAQIQDLAELFAAARTDPGGMLLDAGTLVDLVACLNTLSAEAWALEQHTVPLAARIADGELPPNVVPIRARLLAAQP